MSRPLVSLLAILMVGLVLRLYDLGGESLWFDEGITVHTVQAPMEDLLVGRSVHPPLYYLIIHLWTRLFGDSEFSVRFPSVVFGVMTIYLTYRLGHILFNRNVGLIAAAMVALSLFQIRYSQEARNYMLMCMLSTASYFYLAKLEKKSANLSTTIFYLLSSVLLLYTHIFGLFAVASHTLYFLVRKWIVGRDCQPYWHQWIAMQAVLAVLYLPWASVVWQQVVTRQGGGASGAWQTTPSVRDLVGTFASYCGSVSALAWLLIVLVALLGLPMVAPRIRQSALSALARRLRRCPIDQYLLPVSMLLIGIIVVFIVPLLLSLLMTSFYRPRYTISASIPFYLLLSFVLFEARNPAITTAAVVILLIIYGFDAHFYYAHDNKERWREATHYVESEAIANDLVIVNTGEALHTNFKYYSTRNDLDLIPYLDNATRFYGDPSGFENSLDRMIRGRYRVWIVVSHSDGHTDRLLAKFAAPWRLLGGKKFFSRSHVGGRAYLGVEILLYGR